MADKNYENDFTPVYAIGYPKTVGDHFGEYEVLKVDNKTVVFDDRESKFRNIYFSMRYKFRLIYR